MAAKHLRRIDPGTAARALGFAANRPARNYYRAVSPARMASAWEDLGTSDKPRAVRARWILTLAGEGSVRFLGDQLRPVTPITSARVLCLIADLHDDRFAVREQASAELSQHGDLPLAELRKALTRQPPPESRRRIESLLASIDPESSPEQLRQQQALAILEQIGTPQALAVLQTVAKGTPEARLTLEAQRRLERQKQLAAGVR
jgi:hypothetical protein